jgi:quercetin dioxygenase-like cupin family protein
MAGGDVLHLAGGRMEIIGVTEGAMRIETSGDTIDLAAGQFCLIPAKSPASSACASSPVTFLQIYADN